LGDLSQRPLRNIETQPGLQTASGSKEGPSTKNECIAVNEEAFKKAKDAFEM
jgi:hypothetical protein